VRGDREAGGVTNVDPTSQAQVVKGVLVQQDIANAAIEDRVNLRDCINDLLVVFIMLPTLLIVA
jgi:hypothetical protein